VGEGYERSAITVETIDCTSRGHGSEIWRRILLIRFKGLSAFLSSYLNVSAHVYHWHSTNSYCTNGCIFPYFDMRVSVEKAKREGKKRLLDNKTHWHLHLLLFFFKKKGGGVLLTCAVAF
jgi:hypothetical protein